MKGILTTFFTIWCFFLFAQGIQQVEDVLEYPFSSLSFVDVELNEARAEFIKKQTGLRFQSSFTNNEFAGLDIGSVYRIAGGLQMNLLEFGLMDRNHRLKQLDIERQILEIEQDLNVKDKNYAYVYNYFIYKTLLIN